MLPEPNVNSSNHVVRDVPPAPPEWHVVQDGNSAAPAQPYFRRLTRAVALVVIAVMAHVWLGRTPRDTQIQSATLAVASPVVSTVASAAEPIDTAESRSVTVETRLVPVGTVGTFPVQTDGNGSSMSASLQSPASPSRAVADSMAAEPVADAIVPEPVAVAAQHVRRADDAATPANEPANAAGEKEPEPSMADAPLVLTPLAASRRASDLPPSIPIPAADTGTRAPERVINAAPIVEPDQTALVNRVLEQYAAAYERLDVDAAKVVYPTVNRNALRRAFSQLEAQRVTFERCGITITGRDANARCQGEAAYRPRVGARSEHRASREWTFNLAKADEGWQIVKATVRDYRQ